MSVYVVEIKDFIERSRTCPVIDVRTPLEYSHGHIPGSVNMPLFSNEERSVIGTLYLQKGAQEATRKGLDLVGPRMKEFIKFARELEPHGEIALYCWRGGMRSKSLAWLLNTAGIKSFILNGGYKSYRRFIHEYMALPFRLVVIGGMTGSGKTEILQAIEKEGVQVIHLEKIASHRGSVFGHLDMPSQPTTEQFENDLFTALYALEPEKTIFVEDESIAIGRIFIPRPFYGQMSSACFVHLVSSFENRVIRLVNGYTAGNREGLTQGTRRIEKRLGTENARNVVNLINEGNMKSAVEIVLQYYDKAYMQSMGKHRRKQNTEIYVNGEDVKSLAFKIKTLYT